MKILALTAFYPPFHHGGYELRCKDVLEGLSQKGHEICLITNQVASNNVSDHKDPFSVLRILSLKPSGGNVFYQIHSDKNDLKKIEKSVESFRPDLLYLWHIQNLSDAILPYLAKQNLPIVYDEGGSGLIFLSRLQKRGLYYYKNDQDSLIKRWLKRGIKGYARLISGGRILPDWCWPTQMKIYFNSRSNLSHAREMGAQVDDAVVIPSGIDISKFPFKGRTHVNNPVKILIPARIKEAKGCKDGILLIDELRKKAISARVLIIGEVQSEFYYDELVGLTKALGLSNSVKVQTMVNQTELSEIYRDSDICFFPSYFKSGFSRVPLEAMASGAIAISYGGESSGEVIQHNQTGLLVEEGNITEVANWVVKLIQSQDLYLEIVKNARVEVEKKYLLEFYVDQVESYLSFILEGQH